MLDDLYIWFAWGLQWRWTSSMVGGFWPDWGGLPSSRCGGPDVNGDKNLSMSGENAPFQIDVSGKTRWVWTCWSDMADSGLPRFLAIHILFQGSQAQCERLRAIFIPSSCSNLYSSTSVRTSEFAIHPGTWGSGIQSVTSQFFLWQYTNSNIMQENSWKFRLHLRSEQDAEEGDVIAWWSQSERALRGAYGPNLHSTLASNDGRHWA